MLTPREIVFRLNGGGDVTPLGGVDVRSSSWSSCRCPSPVPVPVPVVRRRAARRHFRREDAAERVLRQVQPVLSSRARD